MIENAGKYDKKRLEILKSAAAAFRRRGYHGASVDVIARALHMTKGNLYHYFRDKEDILFVCHNYSIDLLLQLLKEVEATDLPPEQKVHKLIREFVHIIIDELHGTALTLDVHPLSPQLLSQIVAKRDKFEHGIRRIIKSGMDSGVFRKGDPKLVTFALLGSVNWIPRWFHPSGPAKSDAIGQVFADYLLAGLLNDHAHMKSEAAPLPDSISTQ